MDNITNLIIYIYSPHQLFVQGYLTLQRSGFGVVASVKTDTCTRKYRMYATLLLIRAEGPTDESLYFNAYMPDIISAAEKLQASQFMSTS